MGASTNISSKVNNRKAAQGKISAFFSPILIKPHFK